MADLMNQIPPNHPTFFITSPFGTKRKASQISTAIPAIASSALSQLDNGGRIRKKRKINPAPSKALPPKQLWKEVSRENCENGQDHSHKPSSLQKQELAKMRSHEAASIWKLLVQPEVDKHDEALRALESVDPNNFNINYCPGNESKGKTIFWLASSRCHLPILQCMLEKFPNVDVNTTGLYAEDSPIGVDCKNRISQQATAFAVFIRQIMAASFSSNKDANFFKIASSIIEYILKNHPKADVNAIVPSNLFSPENILCSLYSLMVGNYGEEFQSSVLYILENFPNANIKQNSNGSLFYNLAKRNTEYASIILQKNLTFNPTTDSSIRNMIEANSLESNHYSQLILQAHKLNKENQRLAVNNGKQPLVNRCKFSYKMIQAFLYKADAGVYLHNLASLYMTGMLRLPKPCLSTQERAKEITAKVKEWDDLFNKFEIFFQAQDSEVPFPTEVFEYLLICAFNNDPYMTFVNPELITERFYNRASQSAVVVVNLIFIKLQKNYKQFKNLDDSKSREKKQTIWKSLDTALTEMNSELNTTILLTPQLRKKLIDKISQKQKKPPRMTSIFIKEVIQISLNEISDEGG